MKSDWVIRPLSDYVTPRPGNNKIIKGKQSDRPGDDLVQGYSASGPDVWVTAADYNQPGIVISAVGARCGKTFFAEGEWTAIANTQVLLPGKDIEPRWLWYRTNDEDFWIRGGTAQPFVKVRETLENPCLIPPLPEQQRIVALLDEAFAGLATAKANAERNLHNAGALFENHLQSIFSLNDSAIPLSVLAEEITDGDHSPPPKAPSGIPFVTISDIDKQTSTIDFTDTYSVPEEYFNRLKPNKKPRAGDILYTVTGATLGIPILIKEQRNFCFQRHIGLIRPRSEVNSSWLAYALRSPQVFQQASTGATGAAQKTVSLGVLRNLLLPKADLRKQVSIATELDSLHAETQLLTQIYERKLAALEELKKSLLQQAFNGEL